MNLQLYDAWLIRNDHGLGEGTQDKVARQHASGKYTALERLNLLLDPESFIEFDRQATSAVITGFGTIDGRQVAIYAQDFTIKGGSLDKRHAEKICKIMDKAAAVGCPIIGMIDSGGARIDQGIHALAGYGSIFKRNAQYSGVIPQISLILGPCAGGAVYSPALTDFVIMVEQISQMFITGPQVIQEVMHQTITKEALGGAQVHAAASGVAHLISPTEDACFTTVKQLLAFLPSSYCDELPVAILSTAEQASSNLASLVPSNKQQAYNVITVIGAIVDDASFFQLQEHFAPNIVIGFARMAGNTVGIVANQPLHKAGTIDIDASCKAARFVQCCDSFGVPIITLVDTPGFLPGIEQEHNGIIRHGAKLLYAYATASVPKITLILRKAFGGAYIVMGSKEMGADINYAWPDTHIAVLGAKAAVTIMHGKHLARMPDDERHAVQQDLEQEYAEQFLNPFIAAEYGYIDAIIQPAETRQYLIQALSVMRDKVERHPTRKHGNMPL